MSKQIKVIPLPEDIIFADQLIIEKTSYPKNEQGNDTDFSIGFMKDDRYVKPSKSDTDINDAVFFVCKYLWDTEQPDEYVFDATKVEKDG